MTLYIVIHFLVLWSFCLSISFVYFKNTPTYFTKEDYPGVYSCVKIPAAKFSFQKFVWVTLFLFSLSSLLVWRCPLPIFPSLCYFHFLRTFWFFLDLIVLFPPSFLFFHFSFERSKYLFIFGIFFQSCGLLDGKFFFFFVLIYSRFSHQAMIIIAIINSWDIFTPELADSLSREVPVILWLSS